MPSHWSAIKGVDPDKRRVAFELRRRWFDSGVKWEALAAQVGPEVRIGRSSFYRALDGTRRPHPELADAILNLRPVDIEADDEELEAENARIRRLYEKAYPKDVTPEDRFVNRELRTLVELRRTARTSEKARQFLREAARNWGIIHLAKLVQRLEGFDAEDEDRAMDRNVMADTVLTATAGDDLAIIFEEVATSRSTDEQIELVGECAIEYEHGGTHQAPDGRTDLAAHLMSFLSVVAPLTGSIERSIRFLDTLAERRHGHVVELYLRDRGGHLEITLASDLPLVLEALRQSPRLSHLAERFKLAAEQRRSWHQKFGQSEEPESAGG